MPTRRVILGLGSNVEPRRASLEGAIAALRPFIAFTHLSPVYENAALLPESAPDAWNTPFLNMVAAGTTELTPEALLAATQATEKHLGRQPRGHWGPREIDIDLLDFEGTACATPTLTLPHPHWCRRAFVVLPLADILPDISFTNDTRVVHDLAALYNRADMIAIHPAPELPGSKTPMTQLVGILNTTPDSFSDGGLFFTPEKAAAQIERLLAEGASVIDIGAESTRPGATPVTPEEEWQRLEPILHFAAQMERSPRQHAFHISVDTRHPDTAAKALRLGVHWINDVTGFTDPRMVAAVRDHTCSMVVMHSLSVPADPAITLPPHPSATEQVLAWAETRLRELEKAGIPRTRIILDPGIGFGKTPEQSLNLLHNIARFKTLGVRLLVGHSRKSFMKVFDTRCAEPHAAISRGAQSPNEADASSSLSQTYHERDAQTAALSLQLVRQGVDFLRVHNVAANARALAAFSAYGEIHD